MSKKLLTVALFLGQVPCWGQAPTVVSTVPGRNAGSVPRTGAVSITFSQPMTGAADLRLFGTTRGLRPGASGGDGTATLRLQPSRAWAPGEEASLTVPATVRGAGTGGQPLAGGQVVQFRAAAGPGTGSFTIGARLNTNSSGIKDVNLADVNNDGNLDVLVADNQSSNAIQLYLGNGQGGFGARTTSAVAGGSPVFLTTADFNRDGNVDLACTGFFGPNNGTVVALGNGQGTFTQSDLLTTPTMDLAPRVGDVNADGNPDLVYAQLLATSAIGPPYATELLVRLGDGQGHFTSLPKMALLPGQAIYAVGSMQLADLNRDGRLDLLYCGTGTTQLQAYLGNGQGGFVPGPAAAIGTAPVLADLTGDGILDAVHADATAGNVRVHAGDGQGGFAATATATFATAGALDAKAADADGDGDLDLFIAEVGPAGTGSASRNVRLWLNNGTGAFTAGTTLPTAAATAGAAGPLALGDVNNDGAMDVAVAELSGDSSGPFIGVRLNTALATAPQLISFTPAAGPAGTVVTLTGTNFTGATAVLLNGVPLTGFVVSSSTSITVTVPAGAASGFFTVLTPTGQATSATAFQLVLSVRAGAGGLAVELYPNPAHRTVQLRAAAPVRVEVLNGLGQCVAARVGALRPDVAATLDLSGLAPGLYTVRLTSDTATSFRQLVVE